MVTVVVVTVGWSLRIVVSSGASAAWLDGPFESRTPPRRAAMDIQAVVGVPL